MYVYTYIYIHMDTYIYIYIYVYAYIYEHAPLARRPDRPAARIASQERLSNLSIYIYRYIYYKYIQKQLNT